VKKVEK